MTDMLSPEQVNVIALRAEWERGLVAASVVFDIIATLRQAWADLAASEEMIDAKQEWAVKLLFERDKAEVERDELKVACIVQSSKIEQILAKALGFPWYKDDQANFPGATEADGVCVGEHTAETLAEMIVKALYKARAERDRAWAELGALKEAT